MRCLAIAQTCKKHNWKVVFISDCKSDELKNRIINENFELIEVDNSIPYGKDIQNTLQIINSAPDNQTWVMLDGYHFNEDYQKCIKSSGKLLLVLDDMAHLDYYEADIILNQEPNAASFKYKHKLDSILLLGTKYVLLRNEFLEHKKKYKPIKNDINLLVSLGGADPNNVTLKILKALDNDIIKKLNITTVLGSNKSQLLDLENFNINTGRNIEILFNVQNMPRVMSKTDLAITNGGSTCWELAYMGIPFISIIFGENQINSIRNLVSNGITSSLGWYNNFSHSILNKKIKFIIDSNIEHQRISQKCQKLVDGYGSIRLFNKMNSLLKII